MLGGPDLGASLARWAAEAAVDDAARTRARERWLRLQSEEEATLDGTLVDLAERGRPVVIDVAGQSLRGRVVGVGVDFVALRTDQGGHALVRTAAVEVVRVEPGGADVVGDRSPLVDVRLAGVLGPVAADRPDVAVRTTSGAVVRGELRRVGVDVCSIRPDGDARTPTWVAIDAIAVLLLHP